MASLVKEYTKEKLTGQIFTPFFIVDKILDDVGFNSPDILNKKILDPACGDGRFLVKIAERIIKYSPKEKLVSNLQNIYGWDIDEVAINQAINKLNQLIKPFNITVNWNISKINSLHKGNIKNDLFSSFNPIEKFDFIVGNPPYIRIQHLDIQERKFIQNNYQFCKSGSTDIYIAFYELALNLLKDEGKAGYITPNTFFYTDTAKELRKYFETKQNIIRITNYGHIQLFDDATTYSAIVIFEKKKYDGFLYQQANDKTNFRERKIDYQEIKEKKFWQLSVRKLETIKGDRLGDITKIHVGITTLADKIYMMPFIKKEGDYIFLQSKNNGIIKIEKDILKPIIKVSTLKSSDEPIKEYILFPYKKINGKYKIISEIELKENFPFAYEYLLKSKLILDKRDNGKLNSVAWYAFGRTQGLDTTFGRKILFSPMNKEPNFILSEYENATFYSGYCIKYDGDCNSLLKQLNSKRMKEYIQVTARDFRGGWKAYNKKIVQEFIIKNTHNGSIAQSTKK
jgi:methylase of polypeptide subunit release factors